MRSKTTLILLGFAIVLGAWIKFYESKRPNTEEAQRRSRNVVTIDQEKVEGIQIQNGEEKIELRRANGKWRLEVPIQDQADAPSVENLLSDLESWQKDETIAAKEIDSNPDRLAEYDLVKPKLRLKLLGREQPPEILFGKDAALEGRMYVRFEDSKETFLVRQNVKADIAKKPEDFRDRKLTDIGAAQVTRLVLKTQAGEIEAQKQGELWEIVKPLRARADTQKINDLIAQVTGARIEQFVGDDRGDLQPFGLTSPRGSITLFIADDKDGRTLQVGSVPEKEKDQIYVRFSARNFVYTLPNKIESILSLTPTDLRDRHLVRIDTNVLDRLTIDATGKAKTVLARKDQGWTIANSSNQPANTAEVTRLLELLKNEQVAQFVDDVASDLPKYGLDKPQMQLTFSSVASENTAESNAGEQPFATVAFGRNDGDNVYARVGEEPFIVAVRRSLLDNIFADPIQWQELAIFKFKPEEVHRLAVTTDREIVLTREPRAEWARSPAGEPVNFVNVQSLLNTLTKLRAVRWIGGPMPPQAFDKVQATINFTTSPDDKTSHRLIVGGPAGDGMWYGRVEGRQGVFVLSNPDFNALRLSLAGEPPPSPTQAAATASASSPPSASPASKP